MAYSQLNMEKQLEQFAAVMEEFSRLEALQASQLKALGLTKDDLGTPDIFNLPPELKQMVEEAQESAKRAGEARAAQSDETPKSASSLAPGAGRRGVVRL